MFVAFFENCNIVFAKQRSIKWSNIFKSYSCPTVLNTEQIISLRAGSVSGHMPAQGDIRIHWFPCLGYLEAIEWHRRRENNLCRAATLPPMQAGEPVDGFLVPLCTKTLVLIVFSPQEGSHQAPYCDCEEYPVLGPLLGNEIECSLLVTKLQMSSVAQNLKGFKCFPPTGN